MKKATLAVIAVFVLFSAAGCGGDGDGDDGADLSKTEQAAADSIATHFAESSGGVLAKKDAQCFGDKFVAAAGLEKLEKAKLIDKDGKVLDGQPKFDKKLSGNYADAYLGCVDFAKTAAESFAKSDKTVDEKKLADCLDKELPDSLMKKVIVASQSGETEPTDDVTEANTKLKDCQKTAKK